MRLRPGVRWAWRAAGALAVLLVGIAIFVATHWPYSERRVQPGLNKAFHGDVKIEGFRAVYFPQPGFIATGLTLRRGLTAAAAAANPAPPLATAERVVVEGRYINLLMLQHRVRLVQVEGLHVTIPPRGTEARAQDFPPGDGKDFSGPRTTIEDLHITSGLLELQPGGNADGPGRTFLLHVQDLLLLDVVKDHAARFQVTLEVPKPDATVHAEGTLGPLHSTHLADTPVGANFSFAHGRLEDFRGMHGVLDGTGRLRGVLSAIDVEAQATSRGFAVNKGTPVDVRNEVKATVNGMNGDTALHSVDAHTGRTTVHGSGSVAGSPKVTEMELRVVHGRIEDVMRPFLATPPPVSGDLHLVGHAWLAPIVPGKKFLDRLTMQGVFDIPDERFTKVSTEEALSAFSRRAEGLSPRSPDAKSQAPDPAEHRDPNVLISVKGPVQLRNGVASTRALEVSFEGASMLLGGTFNLRTVTAHLTGNLHMKSDISHVTTGWKSALLKPLGPFFKHHVAGDPGGAKMTVVPIAITGTRKFKVSSNLLHKK